jgi:hypothetical protein
MQRAMFSSTAKAAPSLKIMFLGAPGAGKGTYASRIAPMLDIPTISTGDLVRYEIKNNTALGDKIKVRAVGACCLSCRRSLPHAGRLTAGLQQPRRTGAG